MSSARGKLFDAVEAGRAQLGDLTYRQLCTYVMDTEMGGEALFELTDGDPAKLLTVDLAPLIDADLIGKGRFMHLVLYKEVFVRAFNTVLE